MTAAIFAAIALLLKTNEKKIVAVIEGSPGTRLTPEDLEKWFASADPHRPTNTLQMTAFDTAQKMFPGQTLGLDPLQDAQLKMWTAWWLMEAQKEIAEHYRRCFERMVELVQDDPTMSPEMANTMREVFETLIHETDQRIESINKVQEPAEDVRRARKNRGPFSQVPNR